MPESTYERMLAVNLVNSWLWRMRHCMRICGSMAFQMEVMSTMFPSVWSCQLISRFLARLAAAL